MLGKSALVEREVRADDDDGASRVVDTFTEKVLTKVAVLAFEVISERLERAAAAAENAEDACASAHGIIQKCVDSFLQDSFFVAEDDVRRMDGEESLQAVVTVDDTAVKVVEIR